MKLTLAHGTYDREYVIVWLRGIPFPTGAKYIQARVDFLDPIIPRDFPDALHKLANEIEMQLTSIEEQQTVIEKDAIA